MPEYRKKNNGKNDTGRPSKYKSEFCQALIDFYDVEPYEEKDGKRLANKLPTLRNFAKEIKVDISTVYDWVDPNSPRFKQEFSDAFKRAKNLLKWFLIENGLNGCHNALYAKFVAINMTDMSDRKELTGADGGPIKISDLTRDELMKIAAGSNHNTSDGS